MSLLKLQNLLMLITFCLSSASLFAYFDDDPAAPDEELQGACNQADREHIFKENHDFAKAWDNCGRMSGLDLGCFDREYPSEMSESCLLCFDQMTKCAVSNCAFKCMFDRRGPQCRRCTVDSCGEEMQACSGVSQEQLPDFARKRRP